MAKEHVLLIEDEADIAEIVQYNLAREGFGVSVSRDGETGLREARTRKPNVVVLDLMLPGLDGLEVCRQLRAIEETRDLPIVMLTAKGEESDIVLGLGVGADDYLTKPFSPKELVARIRAVLRRSKARGEAKNRTRLSRGPLTLDSDRFEALVNEAPIELTRAEFRLLWALCLRPGRVLTRNELADAITAGEAIILDRNVDVHVSAVRRKLGAAEDLIVTVRGVGYKCRE
jgi:DNA-binding response OmpR family regulator